MTFSEDLTPYTSAIDPLGSATFSQGLLYMILPGRVVLVLAGSPGSTAVHVGITNKNVASMIKRIMQDSAQAMPDRSGVVHRL